MRSRIVRCASLFAVAVLVGSAGASPADADWVAAGYLGASHTLTGTLSLSQADAGTNVTFSPVDYHGESFTPPLYYGGRITYFWPGKSWLGVEAEFVHLKVYARTDRIARVSGRGAGIALDGHIPIRDILERFSVSHGLNFALVNVVARRGLAGPEGVVTLLGRAGIGPTIPHAESQVDGMFREGYELGALGTHVAAGIEMRLARRLAGLVEYKITTTNQRVAIAGGHVRGRFTSHHGVLGVSWHP